ncbi:MAG: hypothetical protein FWG73_01520 [Planctomycetaceae bacterium]|nr:hypothetical protein [Planctomycetaceae bacterium]
MSQENASRPEGTPRKHIHAQWVSLGCVLVTFVLVVAMFFRGLGPLNTENLEGTVVILDENGEAIPYRDTIFTFYSHYAPSFFRSDAGRKRNLYIDEQGFGKEVPIKIPKSAATLFFHTRNGKYAAVVDVGPNDSATGLVVELRPRFSATGRLVDHTGIPLANYEFSLDLRRIHDFGSQAPFGPKYAVVETFESEYCETDSEGLFTASRLIPGVEYHLNIHLPKSAYGAASLKMPILQPEHYREPYSLGDVSVRR